MKGKVLKSSIVLGVIIVLFGAVGWLLFSPCPPGEFCIVAGTQSDVDIPEDVREDANSLASEFIDSNSADYDMFVDNLLEVYSEAVATMFFLSLTRVVRGKKRSAPNGEVS